jgi:hypothetical protein
MTERRDDDARIRALLQRFDPAAGDEGLPPAERARMRRAVLDAAGEARPSRLPRLVPVVAACALLLLVLWLAKSPRVDSDPAQPTVPAEGGRATLAPEAQVQPDRERQPAPVAADSAVIAHSDAGERRATRNRRAAGSARAAVASTSQPAPVVAAAKETSPRSIRYVTSSGTQIIWTLDPQLEI